MCCANLFGWCVDNIPESLGRCPNLREVSLGHNKLSGAQSNIPSQLIRLPTPSCLSPNILWSLTICVSWVWRGVDWLQGGYPRRWGDAADWPLSVSPTTSSQVRTETTHLLQLSLPSNCYVWVCCVAVLGQALCRSVWRNGSLCRSCCWITTTSLARCPPRWATVWIWDSSPSLTTTCQVRLRSYDNAEPI